MLHLRPSSPSSTGIVVSSSEAGADDPIDWRALEFTLHGLYESSRTAFRRTDAIGISSKGCGWTFRASAHCDGWAAVEEQCPSLTAALVDPSRH